MIKKEFKLYNLENYEIEKTSNEEFNCECNIYNIDEVCEELNNKKE